jgi:hypothetical protein
MPSIERAQGFDPRTEQVTKRIQELKARAAGSLDEAMSVVEKNLGRREAREASSGLKELSMELSAQESAIHSLDPLRVADLISDPFEE